MRSLEAPGHDTLDYVLLVDNGLGSVQVAK